MIPKKQQAARLTAAGLLAGMAMATSATAFAVETPAPSAGASSDTTAAPAGEEGASPEAPVTPSASVTDPSLARVAAAAASGSIAGTVYWDNNANGRFDTGDKVISGTKLTLKDSSGNVRTAVTDASGKYRFGTLENREYTISWTIKGATKVTQDGDGVQVGAYDPQIIREILDGATEDGTIGLVGKASTGGTATPTPTPTPGKTTTGTTKKPVSTTTTTKNGATVTTTKNSDGTTTKTTRNADGTTTTTTIDSGIMDGSTSGVLLTLGALLLLAGGGVAARLATKKVN